MNLRWRMLLILFGAAIPGMAVALFLTLMALEDEQEQTAQTAEWLAELSASHHSNILENARVALETVRDTIVSFDPNGDTARVDCTAFSERWTARQSSFTALTYFSPTGGVVCATSESELRNDATDADWFAAATRNRDFTVSTYTTDKNGTPLIIVALPVMPAGSTDSFGVLALGINLKWLDFLSDTIELPDDANVVVLDANGVVLTQQEGAENRSPESLVASIRDTVVDNVSGVLLGTDANGYDRVYGFAKTAAGGLTVIVDLPIFVPYNRAAKALLNTLAAPMTVLIMALLATAWASEAFVVRWVRSLNDTAEQLADGDLDKRTDVPYSQGEIGQLAQTFDEMADALEAKQLHTEALVEQREGLLNELNHRTANNMAILLSLLETGRRQHGDRDPETDVMLQDLAGRIRTLANVHRLLYQHVDTATPLQRRDAMERLVDMLAEFYLPPDTDITLVRRIEPIDIDNDRSVTFAMLLNELLCNAYKHAFAKGASGTLTVECRIDRANEDETVVLLVNDDGRGLPADFDENQSLRVATALTRQLDGALDITSDGNGTSIVARFPHRPVQNPD
jgi:two-component sensor histidine kinase